jgi:elongation factor 2
MDATRGVQFLNEIKESVVSGFQWASKNGPLCQEPMRGVIFKLMDVTLHADAIHRGQGQIMPCARQVMFACIYTAAPSIMEPLYIADIACPTDEAGNVYSMLALRRGEVVEEIPRVGTPMTNIRALLPVQESFGFVGALRAATGGEAFPQCAFVRLSTMSMGT